MKTQIALETFLKTIRGYADLSDRAAADWTRLLREKAYPKKAELLSVGQVPTKAAFVVRGLLAQYYVGEAGDTVVKGFFPEGRIAGSIPATLTRSPSDFSIVALEETEVLEYDFHEFQRLVSRHRDVAEFYIRYMERHWIIEKELSEVSLRRDSARVRYDGFVSAHPDLAQRLKKHQIAAFLGITATQMSRISSRRK